MQICQTGDQHNDTNNGSTCTHPNESLRVLHSQEEKKNQTKSGASAASKTKDLEKSLAGRGYRDHCNCTGHKSQQTSRYSNKFSSVHVTPEGEGEGQGEGERERRRRPLQRRHGMASIPAPTESGTEMASPTRVLVGSRVTVAGCSAGDTSHDAAQVGPSLVTTGLPNVVHKTSTREERGEGKRPTKIVWGGGSYSHSDQKRTEEHQ
jgi:hypothetical protein